MKKQLFAYMLVGMSLIGSVRAEESTIELNGDSAARLYTNLEQAGAPTLGLRAGTMIEIRDLECLHEMIRGGRFPFFTTCSFQARNQGQDQAYALVDDQADQLMQALIQLGVPNQHSPGIDQLKVARLHCSKLQNAEVDHYSCSLTRQKN